MRRLNQIVHAQGFLLLGIGKRVGDLDVSRKRPFPTKGSKPPISPHTEPGGKMTFQRVSPKSSNVGGVVTAGQCGLGSDKLDLPSVARRAEGEAYPPSRSSVFILVSPKGITKETPDGSPLTSPRQFF
jgi:hypothetical protein